jgi:hypothetical protein
MEFPEKRSVWAAALVGRVSVPRPALEPVKRLELANLLRSRAELLN